jgi:hypothetical protein
MPRPHARYLIVVLACLLTGALSAPAGAALRAPTLATPEDEAAVQGVPAMTWSRVAKADRYEFQLSADKAFGSIVLGRAGAFQTKNTAATIDKSLPDGAYYWRVRALTVAGKAGKWSTTRSFVKSWSESPELVSPVADTSVVFPSKPLVLQWSSVPRAYKYRLYLATDPQLGSLVTGKVIETAGAVYAPGVNLPPGKYYWGVEAVDSAGHRGVRSAVGAFTTSWPTGTGTSYLDLIDDPRVADPRVSWDPVPGAVEYEVEINFSADFAPGSKVCCGGTVTGTSLSPKTILPNNVYHWRVRAIDANGVSGQWNVGPDFDKNFGNIPPTIANLHMADNNGDQAADLDTNTPVLDTAAPVIKWDPVPGAAKYHVHVFATSQFGCDVTDAGIGTETDTTAWTPLTATNSNVPVDAGGINVSAKNELTGGTSYCVEVYAITGNGDVRSDITQLGGPGAVAFRYQPLPATNVPTPIAATASDYLSPQTGSEQHAAPVFKWKPIDGANSYWVIVSKDAAFTNIVDVALTKATVYAPRSDDGPRTYADDNTPYYWAVLPAHEGAGGGVNFGPSQDSPQNFLKRSIAPVLLTPADGDSIADQPVMRWTSGDVSTTVPEGAASYRLQVAQDPSFGNVIDDVTTQATSYTAQKSYPADTALYWRVRVTDERGVGLSWSRTGSFKRTLQMPTLAGDNPTGGAAIPLFRWNPVQGAVEYDVHVDQADGSRKDFTTPEPAFTPTTFYGTGIWRWQVRAVFPSGNTSAYTVPSGFARRINAPDGTQAEVKSGRVLLRWEPSLNAREYRVEFADTNSFTSAALAAKVQNTAYAPTQLQALFDNGGKIYWRVASVDEGGNVGAYSTGLLSRAKKMTATARGTILKRKRGVVQVVVVDARRRAVRRAKVSVSGAARGRAKRTNKKGVATLKVRGLRKGTATFKVTRGGFRTARATLVVAR